MSDIKVYILRCSDGSLYCGWTNDLERRLAAHNSGKGAKYTRSRRPVELMYTEECPRCQFRLCSYTRNYLQILFHDQCLIQNSLLTYLLKE